MTDTMTDETKVYKKTFWFYFYYHIIIYYLLTKQTPKHKLYNMSTASSDDDSDVSGYSLSYVSKKRKNVESASAPKRRSQRIASQSSSDLTVATSQLRLS